MALSRRLIGGPLDQGVDCEPTIHFGKAATAIESEGKASELGDLNRGHCQLKQRWYAPAVGGAVRGSPWHAYRVEPLSTERGPELTSTPLS
jgi:hypothetical protein